MVLFSDLNWQPHPDRPEFGRYAEVAFPNGWTATFLDGDFSIYMKDGIYEIQPWKPDGNMPEDGDLGGGPFHGDDGAMQIIMNVIESM
jgi:hypothetical protein